MLFLHEVKDLESENQQYRWNSAEKENLTDLTDNVR